MSKRSLTEWPDILYEVNLDQVLAEVKRELVESRGLPVMVVCQVQKPFALGHSYEYIAPDTLSRAQVIATIRSLLETLEEGEGLAGDR